MTTYEWLIGLAIVLGVAFIVAFGPPWRTDSPWMAWLQAGIATASLGVDALLFAVLFRIIPPPWLVISIFAFKDLIYMARLLTLIKPPKRGSLMINHPAAKAIVAALVVGLTAALVAAQTAIPMSIAAHGWVAVGLAFLGAVATPIAVYQQENAKPKE